VKFYLGTHEPAWLARVDVPLMVSRRRLVRRPVYKPARAPWVLDSGGFTELSTYGRWTITARTYAADIERFSTQVGAPEWAAPQDWMCEPFMVDRTSLTVAEHQARTVGNYCELMALGAPVIPVVQGYTLADYERCVDRYTAAGIDLAARPVVGLGSICRRQHTAEIGDVIAAMHARGIRCHGFGCKEGALRRYGRQLDSADSLAWSLGGRHRGTCIHLKSRCANHLHWALDWRASVLAAPLGGIA
jgi:hypothetical protein